MSVITLSVPIAVMWCAIILRAIMMSAIAGCCCSEWHNINSFFLSVNNLSVSLLNVITLVAVMLNVII
jgi:hypothetical protein